MVSNNIVRKTEYPATTTEGKDILYKIRERFDIDGDIRGVSWDGGDMYAVYMSHLPTVGELSNLKRGTDDAVNNLISIKYDFSDNTTKVKVYTTEGVGPSDKVGDKYVFLKGVYVVGTPEEMQEYTLYYADVDTRNIQPTGMFDFINSNAWKAQTFIDGVPVRNESVYTPIKE